MIEHITLHFNNEVLQPDHKLINNQSPRYLFQLIPSPNIRYFSQNSENIPQLRIKHDFLNNSLFPSIIKSGTIRKSENSKALVFSKARF